MCICWCVTEINYKMHGATIKIQQGNFISLNFRNSGCHHSLEVYVDQCPSLALGIRLP